MEFLQNITLLEKISKCSQQFSTALRTFSKCCDLLVLEQKKKMKEKEKSLEAIENMEIHVLDRFKWNPSHGEDIARYVMNEEFRADRFKNMWNLVDNVWKKVPYEKNLEKLFLQYQMEHEEYSELVLEEYENKTPKWEAVKRAKKKRFLVHKYLDTKLTKKEFIKVLIDIHHELQPLRKKK